MLTKRQKQILDYITSYSERCGYAPTLQEIQKHFQLRSVATVHEHVSHLEAKGYLEKNKHLSRAMRAVEQESGEALASPEAMVPLMGYIAAGNPIEAVENPEQIVFPAGMLRPAADHYALRIKGDSMQDEGIVDGDIVLVRRQATVEQGGLAVCIVEEEGATLKRVYKENGRYRLQPSNPAYQPFYPEHLEIRGLVVGLIRNY